MEDAVELAVKEMKKLRGIQNTLENESDESEQKASNFSAKIVFVDHNDS